MANSPASPEPAGSPGREIRAESRRPGRRVSRWVILVLLFAAASLAIATPAFAATHAAHATQASCQARPHRQRRRADRPAVAAAPAT